MTAVPPEAITAAAWALARCNIPWDKLIDDQEIAARAAVAAAAPLIAAAERDRIREETEDAIAELRDAGDERGALWLEAFRIAVLRKRADLLDGAP